MSNGHGKQIVIPGWLMSIIGTVLAATLLGGLLNYRDTYANDERHDHTLEEHGEVIDKHEDRLDAMERSQLKTENHLDNLDASVERIVVAVEKIAAKVE